MARDSSKRAMATIDRRSALPDAVLHSIMSSLTSRQAVQTSVLSRRWRHLWRSAPCLDIDHREFVVPGTSLYSIRAEDTALAKLEEFTYSLLMDHDAPVLERFRLNVGTWRGDADVDRWVRRGIKYRPAALEVTLAKSTTVLDMPPLGPAPSCRLRSLRLCGVRLDGGFADHLRSRCPVLEELELKRCECSFHEIVSTTMKSLVIDSDGRGFTGRQLVVTVPALASIRLSFLGCTKTQSFVLNGAADSLLHASIGEPFLDKSLYTLLGSMRNVRTLEFWGLWNCSKELLEYRKKVFAKLHNLTTLLLGQCNMRNEFGILRFFLENVPSLEKVTLHHCMYPNYFRENDVQQDLPLQYRKLISSESPDLNRVDIKYHDGNTSNLFGLLMSIRGKLAKNTVTLTKVKCPLKIRIRLKNYK